MISVADDIVGPFIALAPPSRRAFRRPHSTTPDQRRYQPDRAINQKLTDCQNMLQITIVLQTSDNSDKGGTYREIVGHEVKRAATGSSNRRPPKRRGNEARETPE